MLVFPYIDPVAFSLGPLQVRWYGLMYLLGFFLAWLFAKWRTKRYDLPWSAEQISDLIFYGALGVIIGGRLGYMLFYNLSGLIAEPWSILMVWQGGMSFHGGLLGVIVAIILFSYRFKKPIWAVADFVAPIVPLGLAVGRIGNFLNGELWGRPTYSKWGMVFPHVDKLARHPSQLYEFALEGVLLFVIISLYASKPRPNGSVSAIFLMCYGLFRFVVEFFREPDAHLGLYLNGTLSMGQLLSIPMFIFGLLLWWMNKRHESLSQSS